MRGCTPLGALEVFVESLDEGAAARSLHVLAGRLHRSLGNDSEKRTWVAEVRRRFDGTAAASFEFDLGSSRPVVVVSDPSPWSGHALATGAMTQALRNAQVGEAVVYSTASPDVQQGACVSAAAAKVSDTRVIGFVLVRPRDAAGEEYAVLQYLAALVWHMQCADHAARYVGTLSDRLSPLDLIELLPIPCLITDAVGRSIERNDAFAEFMHEASMQLATGRATFHDPYLQDSWQVALGEVHATAVRQSLLVSAHDGRQWCLHLVPFRLSLGGEKGEQALILAIVEPQVHAGGPVMDAMVPEPARPLTPAETEVLNAMLQGHSAKVIANSRGASVNTVRSQIMTILGKTGHHNQKSLIAAFAPSGFRNSTFSGFSSNPSRGPGTKR